MEKRKTKTAKASGKKKSKILSSDLIQNILKIADEKSAYDFYAIDIRDVSYLTDYFIIMSCKNERHIKAVAGEIEDKIRSGLGRKPVHIDGDFRSHWVIVDYGNVMVHIFHEKMRQIYNLEDLWKSGKKINIRLK